jgi:hypothetical protein
MRNSKSRWVLLGYLGIALVPACGDREPTLRQPGSEGDASIENPTGDSAAELFGASQIPSFDLYLPADSWEALKVNARDEQYVQAQAFLNGTAIGLVGLRFKGSYGSLYNCFDAAGNNICRKLSMKIKFDEYVADQRLFGLKRLNFQAYRYDDSYLKERLAYDLYRAMDVVVPRAAWALLRVNDEPQGLFGMVEEIDGRFTKHRWPDNGDGNLFKELWPGQTDDAWILAHLETNEEVGDISAFKAFSVAINAASDAELRTTLGSYTDLDYFARYMAVDDAIANFDGITTYYTSGSADEAGNHNFYFYQETTQKFTIIPWDLESTLSLISNFGNVPSWQTVPADCTLTYLVWGGPLHVIAPGCTPVFRALAADLESYRAAGRRLLDGPFAEARVLADIDTLAAFVRAEAIGDPHGPGATAFENAIAFQRQQIPNLRLRLEHLLTGAATVPLEIDVTSVMDFENADDYGITAGTIQLSNGNTTASVAVNTTDPINGAKTLRVLFDFGNETAAWQQWTYYHIPLVAPPQDVTSLSGVRFKVRSNQARTLRFDLVSPNNSAANEGVQVGWDLAVTTLAQELTVLFADARIPSWAADPGDDLNAILQTVVGISFQPICNGRNASGQLPDGVADNGWVDIDDIEFF